MAETDKSEDLAFDITLSIKHEQRGQNENIHFFNNGSNGDFDGGLQFSIC